MYNLCSVKQNFFTVCGNLKKLAKAISSSNVKTKTKAGK